MPELPEVETISSELNEVLSGRFIKTIQVLNEKSFFGESVRILSKKIKKIHRKAKMIVIDFDKSDFKILIHLKMTGQLVWRPSGTDPVGGVAGGHPTEDWLNKLPSKHTRIVFSFDDNSKLFFNDLRKFGWVKLIHNSNFIIMKNNLPPDVVDSRFDEAYFKKILSRSGRAVKILIMDQTKVGGVGNIYACDALFEAKVKPLKKACDLTSKEALRLYKAIGKVINLGIKYKGATYSDFVSSRGMGGKYQEYFLVYDREGKPCYECNTLIEKMKLGGRGTYFCPRCQS